MWLTQFRTKLLDQFEDAQQLCQHAWWKLQCLIFDLSAEKRDRPGHD
jgi:hypothetical protein